LAGPGMLAVRPHRWASGLSEHVNGTAGRRNDTTSPRRAQSPRRAASRSSASLSAPPWWRPPGAPPQVGTGEGAHSSISSNTGYARRGTVSAPGGDPARRAGDAVVQARPSPQRPSGGRPRRDGQHLDTARIQPDGPQTTSASPSGDSPDRGAPQGHPDRLSRRLKPFARWEPSSRTPAQAGGPGASRAIPDVGGGGGESRRSTSRAPRLRSRSSRRGPRAARRPAPAPSRAGNLCRQGARGGLNQDSDSQGSIVGGRGGQPARPPSVRKRPSPISVVKSAVGSPAATRRRPVPYPCRRDPHDSRLLVALDCRLRRLFRVGARGRLGGPTRPTCHRLPSGLSLIAAAPLRLLALRRPP